MKFIILAALFAVAAATYGKDSIGSAPVYSATASETTYSSSASVATASASASVDTSSSSVSDSSYSSPTFSTPTYSELTYTTVVHPTETTSGLVYSEVSASDAVHVNASGEDDEDDDDDDDDEAEADNGSHAESESLTQGGSSYATTSLTSSSNGKPEYTTDANVAEIDSAPVYQAPGTVTFNEELSVAVPSVYEAPATASSFYEENATIPPNFLPYWLRPSATQSY